LKLQTTLFFVSFSLLLGYTNHSLAQSSAPPSAQNNPLALTFSQCVSDSIIGLDIAKSYFFADKSKQNAIDTGLLAGDSGKNISNQLIHKVDRNAVANPYQFAEEVLSTFMSDSSAPLENEISKDAIQACFYKSEVIYFAFTSRGQGKSKDEARQRVEAILKNRNVASSDFIAGTVEFIYSRPNTADEAAGGRRSFIRNCLVTSAK
jgi:hypothetical protein